MATWRNRIVSEGEEDPWRLLPNPLNWRVHPPLQAEGLADVLDSVGWVDRIIVNQRTGRLVDGHLRVALARAKGMPTVPVCYVDLSEDEEKLVLATFDPLTGMAMAEKDTLRALLLDVQPDSAALREMLDMLAAEAGINLETEQSMGEAPDAQMDAAEELREKWQTAPGQIWEIPSATYHNGVHRLLCGDSTDAAAVARLMGGKTARWMWTDPPYGVDYTGRTADALKIQNDGADDLPALLAAAFRCADAILVDGAPIYVAHPGGILSLAFGQAFVAAGWHYHETLIWVKNSMVLGHSDYHYKHEPILYGWKGENRFWYAGRDQVTVFEVDRPSRSELHPTMKPPELIVAHLRNSSRRGDLGYEPFCGSGSTMVAAEQLGRICYANELEPKYMAVTLQRMADMGLEPRRL